MIVNVVQGGTPALFNAMLFPEATPETKQWLYDQFHRDKSMLTDMGRQFMETAGALYKRLNDPSIGRMARSLVRNLSGIAHPNTILPITTLSECQGAKPVMQRYIMAEPSLRRLYHRQLCDGYSDSYVDHDPGVIGVDHYDYRRVMNGVVEDVMKPDGTWTWCATMYPDELAEGDRELEVDETFIILAAWDTIKLAMYDKKDPTDIFNGDLEI